MGLLLLVGWLSSCNNSKKTLVSSDPYLDSFRGHELSKMIGTSPQDSFYVDTTQFDASGNIIRMKKIGLREQRSFNDQHLIVRLLKLGDGLGENYVVKYRFDELSINQQWFRLRHLNWTYNNKDSLALEKTVEYRLDETGRIVECIDPANEEKSFFKYNASGQVEKVVAMDLNDKVRYQILYYYQEGFRLDRRVIGAPGETPFREDFFNGNLLDSTRFQTHTVIYRFE